MYAISMCMRLCVCVLAEGRLAGTDEIRIQRVSRLTPSEPLRWLPANLLHPSQIRTRHFLHLINECFYRLINFSTILRTGKNFYPTKLNVFFFCLIRSAISFYLVLCTYVVRNFYSSHMKKNLTNYFHT